MGRLDIASLALGAVAAVLVLLATSAWGPAIYQLGMHNAVAAQCLLDGETMRTTRGEVFAQWPPLLAWLLAGGKLAGLSFETTARILNAASAAVIVSLTMLWIRRLFAVSWAAALAGVALLLQPTLFELLCVLSSEPLFLALVLASLFAAHAHSLRPSPARLACTTVLAALACLQRYIGVVDVGVIVLLGWLSWPVATRWRDLGLFTLGASAPLAAWMARNVVVAGALTGERPPADFDMGTHVRDAWGILSTWWTGELRPSWTTALSTALYGATVLASFGLLLRPRPQRDAAAWALGFPVAYGVFLIVVASLIWLDPMDARLLSPLLAFACMLAPLGAHFLFQRVAHGPLAGRALGAVLALAASVTLGVGALGWFERFEQARSVGPGGYGTEQAQQSEILRWLREHRLEGPVYSNVPETCAYATWKAALLLPSTRPAEFLLELPPERFPLTVVWLDTRDAPPITQARRRKHLEFEPLAKLADGSVLRVTRP